MNNYQIVRLPYYPLNIIVFCCSLIFGELCGLGLSIYDGDWFGLVGGAIAGLIFGCVNLALYSLLVTVFNNLVPFCGGLPIRVEPYNEIKKAACQSVDTADTLP